MKKLLIMGAVVALTAMSQAASFSWKTSATGKIYEVGTTTLLASGTAYLFDSATVSQQSVLTAFLGTGVDYTKAIDSSAISSGAIAAKSGEGLISWGSAGDTLSAYAVFEVGDNIFISDLVNGTAQATSTTTLSFNLKSATQAAAFADTATFSSGGWYTASVPEPTSGLLILLGMAGLALRRRRA